MSVNVTAYLQAFLASDRKKFGHPLQKTEDFNEPGWFELRENMSYHVLGAFPHRIISTKRPSEDPDWFAYRKLNYQPITKGPMRDIMKDVSRSFVSSNWVLTNLEESVEAYISEERFNGQDFMTWITSRGFGEMILDGNSAVVVMPSGEGLTDPSIPADADLWIVTSTQLIDFEDGLISWFSHEESPLKKKGRVIYIVNDTSYFRANEREGKGGSEFVLTEIYRHNTGSLSGLAQVLGGWPEWREDSVIFRSWFEAYVPFANDVIEEYSTYRVAYGMMGFPIRKEYEKECTFSQGVYFCDGKGFWEGDEGQRVTCSKCKGTGRTPPIHPGHVIEIPRPEEGETVVDELSYLHIPVDSVKDMRESWNNLLERAKEAISLRFIQEKQSGVAKDMDREGARAMMQVIAEWFFGTVIENLLFGITKIRRPLDFDKFKPVVIIPNDFKLKDDNFLLKELQEAAKVSTTSGIYIEKVREYCDKAFGNDLFTKRKVELQLILDPLATFSIEEKNGMKATGAITVRECTISTHAYSDIEFMVDEMGKESLLESDSFWRDKFKAFTDAKYPVPTIVPTFAEQFGGEGA